MHKKRDFLEHIAYNMRRSILLETSTAGSGHPTSALSAADLVAALFFHAMQFDPKNPDNPDNDRFILSKGHASPVLYAVYKELGVLSEHDILTYRKFDSVLEGHPTPRFRWAEAATGSLGQGLSIGLGMALAAHMDQRTYTTYVLMGDSEIAEGSVWEAAEIAAFYELDTVVGIVDCNRLGQSTETIEGYHLEHYARKFEAFGWHAIIIHGHDMGAIMHALDEAAGIKKKPTVILAKTIKGYGVHEAENKEGFHGKAFDKRELPELLDQLAHHFEEASHYTLNYAWKPSIPKAIQVIKQPHDCSSVNMPNPDYKRGDIVMTRKAFGQALAVLGNACSDIVSLDAEVKNSTYADIFEAAHADRFIQCFIAEQNMVGMAVGMQKRGKIPYCSTFGAFFTRAFDQIRMASVGRSPLKLVGSHAGVSIGEDGPSQMALEDIAMMRVIHESCVLYPSDGVSAWKLVARMVDYKDGIAYLRTTRMGMPVIYDQTEEFPIGGCKVLAHSGKDRVCVIGAGITLHEALKAYHELKQEGILIAVIDLYSIKPMDSKTVIEVAQTSENKIITVEDHYNEGGMGQAITAALCNTNINIYRLAVQRMPRSGTPEELLSYEGIDAQAIIRQVKQLL